MPRQDQKRKPHRGPLLPKNALNSEDSSTSSSTTITDKPENDDEVIVHNCHNIIYDCWCDNHYIFCSLLVYNFSIDL